MTKRDYLLLVFAIVVLGIFIVFSPKTETIANEASIGAHGIDILGLTRNARNLPEEEYPAH